MPPASLLRRIGRGGFLGISGRLGQKPSSQEAFHDDESPIFVPLPTHEDAAEPASMESEQEQHATSEQGLPVEAALEQESSVVCDRQLLGEEASQEPSFEEVQEQEPAYGEALVQGSSAGEAQDEEGVESMPALDDAISSAPVLPVQVSLNRSQKKLPDEKILKRVFVVGGSALAVVLVAIFAVQMLGGTVFSPKSQVEKYYAAIASGDIAAASEVCDPNIDSSSRALLVPGTLDEAENRIQDVSVGDLRGGKIPVTYQLDGVKQQVEVPMQEDGTELLFFKRYKMSTPAVVSLPLGGNACGEKLMINGTEVLVPSEGGGAQEGVTVPVYPGVYTVSLPKSIYLDSEDLKFIVSQDVQSSSKANKRDQYDFSLSFTQELDSQVQVLIRQHLEACMATGSPLPAKAPIGMTSKYFSDMFLSWSGIVTMPTIAPVADSARDSSSKQLVLSDGALYYGSTTGGTVAYRIADFKNSQSAGSIAPFDVYVKIAGDQVTLEDSKGEVLFGLNAVSAPKTQASSAAAGDASRVEPKSSLADYSWEEIVRIAQEIGQSSGQTDAIAIAKSYHLLDASGAYPETTKAVALTDGTALEVQIVGVYQDNEADTFKKAGLTFVTKECFANHAMNAKKTNNGGWANSEMRGWLNSSVLNLFPNEVKQNILPVRKLTNNMGSAKDSVSVTKTEDRLWLLSWREMFGTITWNKQTDQSYIDEVLNAEGSQYPYFAGNGLADAQSSDTEGVLVKRLLSDPDRPVASWWTRSPAPNTSDAFGDVNNGGMDNGGLATASQGVAFGFCL